MASTQSLVLSSLFDVKGFVAVVTGGGTGIGLMATQSLVANGARVYIVGRRKEVLDQVVKKYSQSGPGSITSIRADTTDSKSVDELVNELEAKEPNGINILVNNAGISQEIDMKKTVPNVDYGSVASVRSFLLGAGRDAWQQTLSTNLTSHHFVTASLLPALENGRKNAPGHSSSVVNISSISGTTKTHSSGQFAYAASKAALTHHTRMLASTLHPLGIRVNCIEPGVFPSEMTAGGSDENQKSKIGGGERFPANRNGEESDIASAILYLGSRAGNYVNGETIHVDGGALLQTPSAA
ncbi:hypothetical protein FQN57_003584 [Myotisia sp. PD_48]|nr:hypothetical protein FQN57_003584 [Myotisia sp. PD_48]